LLPLMFWGATSSRRHENKVHLVHFFFALKVFLHFQFGFRFMRPLLCLFQSSLVLELCFDGGFDMFVGVIIVGAIVVWAS
jgi:hypothetical protein